VLRSALSKAARFDENADGVGAINVLRAGHARLACEVSGAVMPPAAGSGDYYINLGTYLHALGSSTSPTANRCHVQVRLELAEPTAVLEGALTWFAARERLDDASRLADSDSRKEMVFKEVRISA
jgi:hypothetical protein